MAKKTGSDYIPTIAEIMRDKDERDEWLKANPPHLRTYKITYTLYGVPQAPSFKTSVTQAGALEDFERECSMFGIVPCNVECKEIEGEETNEH